MKAQFATIHSILDAILSKVPLANSQLLARIASGFPTSIGAQPDHENYIDNLFKLIERHKALQSSVMEAIFVHLCRIDQFLPRSVLIDLDMLTPEDTNLSDVQVTDLATRDQYDRIMCRFINYIESSVAADDDNVENKNLVVFLREMVSVFGKVLIPQPTTTSVQYVLFYLLSMKSSFPNSLCDWMLKRIMNKSETHTRRVALLSYLTSFLARAQYVSHSTIINVSKILSNYCVEYIRQSVPEKDQHFSTEKFLIFYATAQSLFYLVIFRHMELGQTVIASLSIPEIVYSKLNPLAACVPSIALKFCDILKDMELAFCHHILSQFHERQLLSTGTNEIVNPIDFYFPFDRCLLPNLSAKVDKFYNHWIDNDDEDTDSDSDNEMEDD